MNMNKYERLNQQKKYRSEKSFSGKKRVAAYCRVSTEKEEQAQSFESQCDFFRCYIEQKKEWEFYKVFADEGISGTSTKKREQFNQMIAEAKQRKFDLLITKEISRFARNTLDSIYYTRELRKVGVGHIESLILPLFSAFLYREATLTIPIVFLLLHIRQGFVCLRIFRRDDTAVVRQ